MFRKRVKKQYPPGTFIPTPARVCAIVQLCLAFTLILWTASQPFIGEIFTFKSRLLFYQDLMGIPANDNLSADRLARLERNGERFKSLPQVKQMQIAKEMTAIQKQFDRSFMQKFENVIRIFAFQFSAYELLWLILSIIIPILLLKRIDGASQVVWLLPILVICYAVDNRWHGQPEIISADTKLFPSEQVLIDGYVRGKLSENIFEQQEQLMQGWHRYLIINWSHEIPSENPVVFSQQAETGEFNFTLARIEQRSQQGTATLNNRESQKPISLLALYFFWNIFFAYTAWKHTRTVSCNTQSKMSLQ